MSAYGYLATGDFVPVRAHRTARTVETRSPDTPVHWQLTNDVLADGIYPRQLLHLTSVGSRIVQRAPIQMCRRLVSDPTPHARTLRRMLYLGACGRAFQVGVTYMSIAGLTD